MLLVALIGQSVLFGMLALIKWRRAARLKRLLEDLR